MSKKGIESGGYVQVGKHVNITRRINDMRVGPIQKGRVRGSISNHTITESSRDANFYSNPLTNPLPT